MENLKQPSQCEQYRAVNHVYHLQEIIHVKEEVFSGFLLVKRKLD